MNLSDKLSLPPLNPDEINGIKFKDIKHLVTSKEKLENILLSTKIILENKDEVLEFFDILLKYGFRDSAINFFEDIMSKSKDYELIDGFNALLK